MAERGVHALPLPVAARSPRGQLKANWEAIGSGLLDGFRPRLESCSTAPPSPSQPPQQQPCHAATSSCSTASQENHQEELLFHQAPLPPVVHPVSATSSLKLPSLTVPGGHSNNGYMSPPRRRGATFAVENTTDNEWNCDSPVARKRAQTDSHCLKLARFGPSPPPAPRRHFSVASEDCSLLSALQRDSVGDVRNALLHEPQAARLPFFEADVEPPLCCAVRLRCQGEIISLLLDHGADVHATDVKGRTPLSILSVAPCKSGTEVVPTLLGSFSAQMTAQALAEPWGGRSPLLPLGGEDSLRAIASMEADRQRNTIASAKLLLEAGADPKSPAATEGDASLAQSCLELARSVGNSELVRLFEEAEADAMANADGAAAAA
eukprot:TRINITY_DN31088_c0_g1_i1.p1 TRINITY_DN31088_c0_g1~~TRINITY_DN31088_c0_g1_i1.p1  ORF type:complete len:379 (-),score=55.80 TRINITY_DN31088_c0_g1_i1:572-1708(-)